MSQFENSYNARELTAEEISKIPEDQKKALLAQPGEEGSIWTEKEGKKGNKYHVAKGNDMIGHAVVLYQLMLKETGSGVTHYIYEGHKFNKWSDGNVSRTPNTPRQFGKSFGGAAQAKPKYLEQLFGGTIDEINFYLETHKEENWEIYPTAINGQIIMARYKPPVPIVAT